MDQDKPIEMKRQELFARYHPLVRRFLFCYDMIKRNPAEEIVVLKKWDKVINIKYNIEIIVALQLIKWFDAYLPGKSKPLSNWALMTIWWIAFDENYMEYRKPNKRLKEIIPEDYDKCYYPWKRRTTFDMGHFKNTNYHRFAGYVSYGMFLDYLEMFLNRLQFQNMGWVFYKDKIPYDCLDFFHRWFIGFIKSLRLKTNIIGELKRKHNVVIDKPRKESTYSVAKNITIEKKTDEALELYETIEGTLADDGDPLAFLDVLESYSDYWVWKSLIKHSDYYKEEVVKHLHNKVGWKYSPDINYEIKKIK